MLSSEKVDQLALALVSVQEEMDVAPKDADNPYFNSKYADLATIWRTAQKVLPKNGLAVVQTMEPSDGTVVSVTTRLLHKSGQWIEGTVTMVPKKSDPQAIGSCITYARRYSLGAIIGMVTDEDDDGNVASGRASDKKGASPKEQKQEEKADSNVVKARKLWDRMKNAGFSKDQILKDWSDTLGKSVTTSNIEKLSSMDIKALSEVVTAHEAAREAGGKIVAVTETK
jgi:hypothetical protein